MPRRRKVIYMLLAVTVADNVSAAVARKVARSRFENVAIGGEPMVARSVRPIPRGSDMARSRYKPRRETPPMLKLMGVN